MIEIRDLAAKLRGYWLRDLGIAAASADGTAEDGAIILGRTVYIPAAGGLVGINQIPTAPYALDIDGQVRIAGDLLPMAGNSWDIGATDAVFGAVYAAELHTHNLVAETKTATIGGRILVAPSTKLISALGVGIPYIDVAANVLTVGDRCYLESAGVVEWLAITSYVGTVTGGFRFNVTRYLSGGAASWAAGTALVNSGQAGAGYIDIYSRYGIPGPGETATTRVGPALSGNTRTGAAWDATAPRWVLGNLKGLYGYAADTYGLAAGDYSATWVAVDATNGFRLMSGAGTVLGQWTAAGGITVGEVAAAKSNIAITAGALKVRSNATDRIALTAAGVLTINDSAGAAVFTFDAATGAEFTKPLTLGAAGGIYQGSGTFSAPTTGLKIWNSAGVGKIAGINTGVEQWYGDTDGLFYAGAGGVILSAAGVTLGETGTKPGAVIAWDYGSGTVAQISVTQGGIDYLTIRAYSLGYPPYGSVRISGYVVYIRNDGNTLPGDLDLSTCYFNGATSGSTRLKAAAVAAGVVTLPAVTGTLALTSDVTAAVVGTSGKLAKFTGTNAVGNSIVTESGAAISVAGAVTVTGQANVNQVVIKGHTTQTAAQIVIQSSAAAEWLSIRGLANGSVIIGQGAAPSLTSADSIAIGLGAMAAVTTSNSIGIGTSALAAMNTSGHSNIAVGYWSLKQLTSGLYNVSVGEGALYAITTGINCFGLGTNVGWNVTGSANIGIGAFAMYYTSTGTDSIYIGTSSGVRVNGTGVTMVGTETGQGAGSTFSISYSTYIGYRSGYNGSTLGSYNVGVGAETLQKNVANATAVGYKAGQVQTGAGFTGVGYQAGLLSTSGANSTLIGSGAGASLTTNGGAVFVGYQAGGNETAADRLYIANSNTTTPLIWGNFATPEVRIYGLFQVRRTTEQVRVEYDASNYVNLTVSSAGQPTFNGSNAAIIWTFTGVVYGTAGVRTRVTAGAPTGGSSGDIAIDTTNSRIYANVAGTWKYAALI